MRGRRLLRITWVLLAMLLVLPVVMALTTWAALYTASGTRWLAQALPMWVPGLVIEQPQGALLGERFQAKRVHWQAASQELGAQTRSITFQNLSWTHASLAWAPQAAWKLRLALATCSIDTLSMNWPTSSAAPTSPQVPDLHLPVALQVQSLQVKRLTSAQWGTDPILQLRLSGETNRLPHSPEQTLHQWRLQSMQWQAWQLAGEVDLLVSGTDVLVKAALRASSPNDQANLSLTGPLSRLVLAGQVRVQSLQSGEDVREQAQALDVQATLTPLAPWPIETASVSAEQLNLQRLHTGWPMTGISGQVKVLPVKAGGAWPAQVRLTMDVRNASSGPWDTGQLPVQQLQADVSLAVPGRSQPEGWAAVWRAGEGKAVAMLAGPKQKGPGGKLSLEGHWDIDQRQHTSLTAVLNQVDTRWLHAKAPDLRLNGPVRVQGTSNAQWRVDGELVGTDHGQGLLPQAVKAKWEAVWQPGLLKVSAWRLDAAGARAEGQGQWQQLANDRWRSDGQLKLQAFDPAVWAPWPRPSGDKAQPTRLQGQAKWQLSAAGMNPASMTQWQGTFNGQLDNSTLLGVSTSGQWQMVAAPTQWQLNAQVKASGNDVRVQATLPMAGNASLNRSPTRSSGLVGAHVTAHFQAPVLAALQPWAAPLGLGQLHGNLVGQVQVDVPSAGQWLTRGDVRADKLGAQWQGEQADLQGLQASWTLSSEQGKANVPWRVQASVEQGRWADWLLQQWRSELDGTASQHTWRTAARVDLPPRTLPSGRVFKESLRLQWAGQGRWQAKASGGKATGQATWQAHVDTLRVSPLTLDVIPTWLDTPGFDANLALTDAGVRWQVMPARFTVLGLNFDVQQAQGQWGEQPVMDIQAQLASVRVAELLARWQPKAGWGGDLSIDGQIKLHQRHAQPWQVDIDLGRQAGDLTLSDTSIEGAGAQALGLRQIRLSLRAEGGVWTARQSLDGVLLGKVEARQVVTPRNALAWPTAGDPLKGDIQASISDARALGAWAPAGWRLAGHVDAQASLAGTLGAPQYQGTVTGQQLGAQNALLGIYLSDGDLKLNLQGTRAQLEQLTLKGGSDQGGLLHITGQANLSGQPEAQLQIKAERFGLLNRSDRRAKVSGQAQVQLKGNDSVKIDGTLTFDEGLFDVSRIDTPTVGDDVNVINRPGQVDDTAVLGEASAAAAKRQWYVQLNMNLGQQLRVKGRGLDTRLSGTLRLTTPNGRPQVHGAVAAVDGSYVSYGQKLVIERGSLNFSGPLDNPRLDIKAMRAQSPSAESSDVKVGVLISGTAVDPRVRLYSEPPMSETEKLSWLVLGRGPNGLGVADIGLLQTAASALWGGEGASPDDTLVGALGLDELSIRQTDGAVRDTIVTVGKQISRRWYLGYERSLNATTGTWQAIYRAAQRFTVRLQTGDDNAIDLIWLWRRGD